MISTTESLQGVASGYDGDGHEFTITWKKKPVKLQNYVYFLTHWGVKDTKKFRGN